MQIFDSSEPLTEEQITLFEQEHSLKLPDKYRDFLKQHNGVVQNQLHSDLMILTCLTQPL